MLVGINYPWIDYGWDFGPPPAWVAPSEAAAWRRQKRTRICEDFQFFARLGIGAVRWFILGDGAGYGTGEQTPRFEKGRWRFDPLPATHAFHGQVQDDFDFVLRICGQYGLRLVPSLIDFYWCFPGTAHESSPAVVKGGRSDIITDPRKRDAFLETVLEPLLDISRQYWETIYAWELMNEPEWVVRRRFPEFRLWDSKRTIPRRRMRDFIVAGVGRINARCLPDGCPAFLSTVGFADHKSLMDRDYARLGIALHQYHYYAQSGLPAHSDAAYQPCFIGELATAVEREWPELQERQLSQTISQRLQCLAEKGYPSAFLWSARAADPATSWTPKDHEQMSRFFKDHGIQR